MIRDTCSGEWSCSVKYVLTVTSILCSTARVGAQQLLAMNRLGPSAMARNTQAEQCFMWSLPAFLWYSNSRALSWVVDTNNLLVHTDT